MEYHAGIATFNPVGATMTAAQKVESLSTGEAAKRTVAAVFKLFDEWKIAADTGMKLLGVSKSTYYAWKGGEVARLDQGNLERISYLLNIHASLKVLLPDLSLVYSWVNRPNKGTLFGGNPPIERMAAGNVADLFLVAEYLNAARGGDYS